MPGQPHRRPAVNLLISLAPLISQGLASWRWGHGAAPASHPAHPSRGERD
jgi:hypothetical protein